MKKIIIENAKNILAKTNLPYGGEVAKDAISGQAANDLIKEELSKNKPLFIARFGWTELNTIIAYTNGIENQVKYGKIVKLFLKYFGTQPKLIKESSGFFSNDIENVKKFCQYQIEIMKDIDICTSSIKQERFIYKYLVNKNLINYHSLFLPNISRPWTRVLEGKKVLVINPFTKSIEKQYSIRHLLFENREFLPEFHLETYKPVLVTNEHDNKFNTWWDALDYMKKEIEEKDFDIALLSCGAFGHPLCAHIKKMNKQAIYLGRNLQSMFGICSSGWLGEKYANKHWITPLAVDLPKSNEYNSYKALKNYI